MTDMEKRKRLNKKLLTIIGFTLLFIGFICCLEEKPTDETTSNNEVIQAEEQPLLKYEIIKIDELQKNRLNIKVLIKETPTIERLEKLANKIAKSYTKNGVYGVYIGFTHNKDSYFTYGTAEYGPNGTASYRDENIGKEYKLDTTNLKIENEKYLKSIDEDIEKEKLNKPRKEKLKKHIFNIVSKYNLNEDTLDITTYDNDFEVSFQIKTDDLNLEKKGVEIIQEILNSKAPSNIIGCDVLLTNKYHTIMVRFNGEKYYSIENGETTDIEL